MSFCQEEVMCYRNVKFHMILASVILFWNYITLYGTKPQLVLRLRKQSKFQHVVFSVLIESDLAITCIFHITLGFGSNFVGFSQTSMNQWKYIQNAMPFGRCMRKRDIATWLKTYVSQISISDNLSVIINDKIDSTKVQLNIS